MRSEADQVAALDAASKAWPAARLSAVVLNAGVIETGDLVADSGWATPIDINLTGVLTGVRAAARAHAAGRNDRPLTVVAVASAGGVFPMPSAPVYAASKGGLVHAVRSLGRPLLAARGVALAAVCPEPVDTQMVRVSFTKNTTDASRAARDALLAAYPRLLAPADVAAAIMALVGAPPAAVAGAAMVVRVDGRWQWAASPRTASLRDTRGDLGAPPLASPSAGASVAPALRAARAAWARAVDPATSRAVLVTRLSPDFRAATRVATVAVPASPPPGHLLVRRAVAGCNASDINFSAGRYSKAGGGATTTLPFPCGFEAVGIVAAVGAGVTDWAPGDVVAELANGCFAECGVVKASRALRVTSPSPASVALLTSGLTAALSLKHALRPTPGDVVLVTAAAGGTGQFVVQLAAAAGARVIALVGSPAKATAARALGAAATIDYTAEPSLTAALKRVAPQGLDAVWETVGGSSLVACVKALKPGGRLAIIGMITEYKGAWGDGSAAAAAGPPPVALPEALLWKGATATGFFLLRHAPEFVPALAKLDAAVTAGNLRVAVDGRSFVGVEAVCDAVEHLHSGQSRGKVVVRLAAEARPGRVVVCPSCEKKKTF